MGVEREQLTDPPSDLTAVTVRAVRSQNGRWGLTVRILGRVVLTHGRVIRVSRDVQLNERQTGGKRRGPKPRRPAAHSHDS